MTVRRLTEDDWQTLRAVRLRALLDAPESFYQTYGESVALTEADWRARLQAAGKVTLLAESAGNPAGMVLGVPAGPDERDPDAALMLSMWVDPNFRGTGVADELTAELLVWSREQGYKRLLLWVYDAAPRAAAFYRRAGFESTGRVDTFYDATRPLTLMSQTLERV
ncbi:GNAT family N-acetyltransferase [Kribbella sandramycini]|uniref:GNAT family N-acetyltransferase n=1 Tax=Kribbella sandramycini TaxID=60450 RepID=A0A7Y4P150_9ACTN|nr:GNAT family N-acetyltransferase [Kribbella sandramycini]MBB6564891.1 ribosomal protein S18 acetylase RimI-like enzyme [Kribbella sandramycini]NOL42588.1 GNAT family N-acetyltransferase [Kribbella sandramycini]